MSDAETSRPRRAVVADDDAETRSFLRSALTEVGFHVSEACDGQELFEMLVAVPGGYFDVVVADQQMPHLYGIEVLARVGSRAPFVIVSGVESAATREAAARFGALAVLRKPVDVQTLLRVVSRAVASAHSP